MDIGSRPSRRRGVIARLIAAVAALTIITTPASFADTASPETPATCAGVWVVVDTTELDGGVQTQCASDYGTGLEALTSAGYEYTQDSSGFLNRIDGQPTDGTVSADSYWSYWQTTSSDSGDWSDWDYAQTGPADAEPQQGDAEGWRFVSTDTADAPPPADLPPNASDATAAESATASPDTSDEGEGSASGPWAIATTVAIVALIAGAVGIWARRRRSR